MIIVTAQRKSFLKAPFCGELQLSGRSDLVNHGSEAAFLKAFLEW